MKTHINMRNLERKIGGYRCKCGGSTGVVDSRTSTLGSIRRRRECTLCGTRVTTHEMEFEGAEGIILLAERLAHKAEILLAMAESFREDLTALRAITAAYKTIDEARYSQVLRP